jgi:hypothetical protein
VRSRAATAPPPRCAGGGAGAGSALPSARDICIVYYIYYILISIYIKYIYILYILGRALDPLGAGSARTAPLRGRRESNYVHYIIELLYQRSIVSYDIILVSYEILCCIHWALDPLGAGSARTARPPIVSSIGRASSNRFLHRESLLTGWARQLRVCSGAKPPRGAGGRCQAVNA